MGNEEGGCGLFVGDYSRELRGTMVVVGGWGVEGGRELREERLIYGCSRRILEGCGGVEG